MGLPKEPTFYSHCGTESKKENKAIPYVMISHTTYVKKCQSGDWEDP